MPAQSWAAGIIAALIIAGITSLVVVYGDVGKNQSDIATMRREINELQRQTVVHGEAVARLEERAKCGWKSK